MERRGANDAELRHATCSGRCTARDCTVWSPGKRESQSVSTNESGNSVTLTTRSCCSIRIARGPKTAILATGPVEVPASAGSCYFQRESSGPNGMGWSDDAPPRRNEDAGRNGDLSEYRDPCDQWCARWFVGISTSSQTGSSLWSQRDPDWWTSRDRYSTAKSAVNMLIFYRNTIPQETSDLCHRCHQSSTVDNSPRRINLNLLRYIASCRGAYVAPLRGDRP